MLVLDSETGGCDVIGIVRVECSTLYEAQFGLSNGGHHAQPTLVDRRAAINLILGSADGLSIAQAIFVESTMF